MYTIVDNIHRRRQVVVGRVASRSHSPGQRATPFALLYEQLLDDGNVTAARCLQQLLILAHDAGGPAQSVAHFDVVHFHTTQSPAAAERKSSLLYGVFCNIWGVSNTHELSKEKREKTR